MAERDCDLSSREKDALRHLSTGLERYRHSLAWRDIGTVSSVLPGVVYVDGLDTVGAEELVRFEDGSRGLAFDISERGVGTLVLSRDHKLNAGMEVEATGELVTIKAGEELLGRVIDPLGRVLDNRGDLKGLTTVPIEGEIPGILDRAPVVEPLETGIKVIDSLIPIGKGQRELILGDRQTGKTAIAIDTIINQKDKGVICIYCSVGKRASEVASVIATLTRFGCMDYTIVMVAEGNDPPGLRYIAPYAATAIGEYFMGRGGDALVVYDDLTNHARTYREISLLLRRPPGREAFPGDIFYIHSRLLERSTHLCARLGSGSLTALPVIETQSQDISAFIPTNLISMTDGQIYLSSSLFQKGLLPAIDIGRSVSRVGGKAQVAALRYLASDLKLSYAQFEELENFSRFGTRIDPSTSSVLEHGRRIRACFTQPRYQTISGPEQILIMLALQEGLLDRLPMTTLFEAESLIRETLGDFSPNLKQKLASGHFERREDFREVLNLLRKRLELLPTESSL